MQNRPNPGETSSSVAIPSQAVTLVWVLPERGRELVMVNVVAMATVVTMMVVAAVLMVVVVVVVLE
jgi:hypothetical protein